MNKEKFEKKAKEILVLIFCIWIPIFILMVYNVPETEDANQVFALYLFPPLLSFAFWVFYDNGKTNGYSEAEEKLLST